MLIYINIHIYMGLLSCCSMHVFIILTHYRQNYEILSRNFDLQSQTIWWLTDLLFHNLLSHNFDFLPHKFHILFPLLGSTGLPYIVVGSWAEIFGLSTDGFTLRPSHYCPLKSIYQSLPRLHWNSWGGAIIIRTVSEAEISVNKSIPSLGELSIAPSAAC